MNPTRMEFRTLTGPHLTPEHAYTLLVNFVVPRPIALVSSLSGQGVGNLAPFSFFQLGGTNPPSVVFSPTSGYNGDEKDTLRNIRETGEFVVNLVSRDMATDMNLTSARLSADRDEWDLTDLTPLPSTRVSPPRVAQSPVHLECRLFKIVPHGEGPGSANYIIGEIVALHFADFLQKSEVLEPSELQVIGRMGGEWYIDASVPEHFRMKRPSAPEVRP